MLPPRTPAERTADLEKAAAARKVRAGVKKDLKRGVLGVTDILAVADADAVLGKMKVTVLVQSMPGVGKIRAAQIMERLGIAGSRRVQGLGPVQREALEREFAAV